MGGGRKESGPWPNEVCADRADLCGSGCGQGETRSRGVRFQALEHPQKPCKADKEANSPARLTVWFLEPLLLLSFSLSFFLFSERGKGKEKDRGRNIDVLETH